jgi:hypothetical protein
MSDEQDNKKQELQRIQDELKQGGVSRRHFLDRMKGIGVGFGAAFLLGMKQADAHLAPGVNVKSTNPAIDDIAKDAQAAEPQDHEPHGQNLQEARYFRVYRRYYRYYHRYHRYYSRYSRYARYYRRYARVYLRF